MPTPNYDGSITNDDGTVTSVEDQTTRNNDAAYNGRVWGDRTTDGPVPKPGTYTTGGFPPDVVAKLLQQPGVRAGIAYFLKKGERPDLNKIAALDQQVIPGYKNLGNQQVEDHSLRNGLLTGAAIIGGGAALQGLTTGFSGAASGLSGATSPALSGSIAAEAAPETSLLGGTFGAAAPAATEATPLAATLSPFSTVAGAADAVVPTQASSLAALGDLAAPGGSSLSKVGNLLGDVGKGISAVDQANGTNRLNQEELGLKANDSNIRGQQAFTDENIGVSKQNATLGNQDLKNQYLLEKTLHPSVGPFNVTGGPKYSPEYLSSIQAIAAKHPELLAKPAPYVPIDPKDVQGATNTAPSTLSKIGSILGPALSVAPKIAALF